MNNLIAGSAALTMSSREIAELTGKEHAHVTRDVESMLREPDIEAEGYLQNWRHPQNGQTYREFALPKDLVLTLVAGYSVKLRKAIIDRWQQLEGEAADPIKALSDPAKLRQILLGYTEKVIELGQKAGQLHRGFTQRIGRIPCRAMSVAVATPERLNRPGL